MQFNTPEYAVFYLAALMVGWLLAGRPIPRTWGLLLASWWFYASNNGWLLLLIIGSTQFDYVAARAIARSSSYHARRVWLAASLGINLGLLGFFKYTDFLGNTVSHLAALVGWKLGWVEMNILLPVGISFYTFEAMSYVIDVYRGQLAPEQRWSRYAFFIAFFPHLIAGPIVRASQFLPQIDARPRLSVAEFERAVVRILGGLVKKMILADTLSVVADRAFSATAPLDTISAWVGVLAFTLQIYFDFSGYTDIALGSARLMGFTLPENFLRPYAAWSITDFWRRWHMSLSTWLRDYVYFPLGGNRDKSKLRVCGNLLTTMLVAGLWHGAAWNFVLWGGLHGILLATERMLGWHRATAGAAMLIRRGGTLMVVALLWVFFRATDMGQALSMLQSCLTWTPPADDALPALPVIAIALGTFGAHWAGDLVTAWKPPPLGVLPRGILYAVTVMAVVLFNSDAPPTFIYFRF